jgi:glucose 1-dehydrogenase
VKADLAIEADLVRLHGETLRAFGQCDILVNNAALTDRLVFAPLAEVDRAGLEKYLATNLVAPFQLMKLFAEGMKARRSGVIINITSGAANFIDPHETGRVRDEGTVYGTSKAGLNRLSNSVAWQLREHGIPVIAVDPGSTQTEVWHLVQSRSPNLAPANGHPVDWPVNVVRYLLECPDPMAYTGQVIVTENFVVEQRLA